MDTHQRLSPASSTSSLSSSLTPSPTSDVASSAVVARRPSSRAVRMTLRNGTAASPRTPENKQGRSAQRDTVYRLDSQFQRRGSTGAFDDKRHSHALSWASNTRDSVVDNLLSSLDTLSGGSFPSGVGDTTIATDFDPERFRAPTLAGPFAAWAPIAKSSRRRGHTQSSSASSELNPYRTTTTLTAVASPGLASPSSTPGTITARRGRRSDVSTPRASTVHSAGTLSPAADVDLHRVPPIPRNLFKELEQKERHRQLAGERVSQQVGSAPRQFSDESLTTVETTSRELDPPAWLRRRSVSMDQLYTETNAWQSSVLDNTLREGSLHGTYGANMDAAPEPNVAAGPRKLENPSATGPVYVGQASKMASLRKVNTQTDLRRSNNNKYQAPPVPSTVRDQASDFIRASSMRNGAPLLSQDQRVPAPISVGSSSGARDMPSPPRERPGFFRRVFGGASKSSNNAQDRRDSQAGTVDSRTRSGTSSVSKSPGSPIVTEFRARTADGPPTRHDSQANSAAPPTLSKRPSSFFRRRKKSLSEQPSVPPLPNLTVTQKSVVPSLPSPGVSSLRKIMNPFLGQESSAEEQVADDAKHSASESRNEQDDLDIFHSGYTPPLIQSGVNQAAVSTSSLNDNIGTKMRIKKRQTNDAVGGALPALSTNMNTLHTPQTGSGDQRPISPLTPNLHGDTSDQSRVSPISWNGRPLDIRRSASLASNSDAHNQVGGPHINATIDRNEFGVKQGLGLGPLDRPASKKSERLYLRPDDFEDSLSSMDGVAPLTLNRIHSEPFDLTSMAVGREANSPVISTVIGGEHTGGNSRLPSIVTDEEDDEYTARARKIFNGVEDDVSRAEAAAWLGERNTLSTKTLQAYMRLFDFSGQNLLTSLRMLCCRLLLRGETQQFDRLIQALSSRWCECNPKHGFRAVDVVHTILYSLILLNTDLHLADIGEKMSRSAYVKNTVPTIRRVLSDAVPTAFDDTLKPIARHSRPSIPWLDPNYTASPPETPGLDESSPNNSKPPTPSPLPTPTAAKRLSLRPGTLRGDSDAASGDLPTDGSSLALVANPSSGTMRMWEAEMESILKSFFTAIKAEPLPLLNLETTPMDHKLSVANMSLRRSGSVISKAPSENPSFRPKQSAFKPVNMWQGRSSRSRGRIYQGSTYGSSRTSLDDNNSLWSPAQSTWSKNSFSKTLTSASMGSLHLSTGGPDFKHSIGFANALSQAIIREESSNALSDSESFSIPTGLLEDEALALEGAPWAKEGLVKHKHHLETPDRKAKERTWNDCFAVISKGKLTLFAFNTSSRSSTHGRRPGNRIPGKAASIASARVGGGDWMENAEQLDVFVLRQTIASTLPPPGYSKTRPHVWALSLPSGAVHLFQVGTPEIATEFMTTANYWSARLSKEPLSGGVSNIEYGWSDQVLNMALLERPESVASHPPSVQGMRGHMRSPSSQGGGMSRPSYQSSLRRSIDSGFGTARGRLPGDKIQIAEWHPPTQSMMASQLLEVDQLKGLAAYVSSMEDELAKHNELKNAIELAYSPRFSNYNRAMGNWQRKSEYLLREIVKFQTYVDSLTGAQQSKARYDVRKSEMDAKRASFIALSQASRGKPELNTTIAETVPAN